MAGQLGMEAESVAASGDVVGEDPQPRQIKVAKAEIWIVVFMGRLEGKGVVGVSFADRRGPSDVVARNCNGR